MSDSFEQYARSVLSGTRSGVIAAMMRTTLACAEPLYAGAMRTRNRLFDRNLKQSIPLGRTTISVGNITTGGTGKTPAVAWLVSRLRSAGSKPCVLIRGYKSRNGQSDEQAMLQSILGREAMVIANPDRVQGARDALRSDPDITHFVLDDGFQHRRAQRDLDLVLINAREPFGFGRVFPRGLLREPLEGLSRASAFLITHASSETSDIEQTLRQHNPAAPLYRCEHVLSGLLDQNDQPIAFEALATTKLFAFAGIGHPEGFETSLREHGMQLCGSSWLDDHAHYDALVLKQIESRAQSNGATALVTTEKDWSKLRSLATQIPLPIHRSQLELKFNGDDESRLLKQIIASKSE